MCGSCREQHPKIVSLNMTVGRDGMRFAEQQEEHEISGSRGSAHFVWRCGYCKVSRAVSVASSRSVRPISCCGIARALCWSPRYPNSLRVSSANSAERTLRLVHTPIHFLQIHLTPSVLCAQRTICAIPCARLPRTRVYQLPFPRQMVSDRRGQRDAV